MRETSRDAARNAFVAVIQIQHTDAHTHAHTHAVHTSHYRKTCMLLIQYRLVLIVLVHTALLTTMVTRDMHLVVGT